MSLAGFQRRRRNLANKSSDYDSMTVAQLKELAEAKGHKTWKKKKAELIAMLRGD
ncbi:hypothetical protein J18TS1_12540 [Oceanobacillus oncorhynchi subsp. incaldanensis]|uniref:hypothetical protein n=1 Tax=Oceanobacillus oncorhynchi TaxID=545501 RepID=UPI001B2CB656|nr:hypothetical protein [Oceanobacillus oncorhynchi]GIO18154.1 hypothetical protein J18TS1_12540 [Oceanobacillus oncorhynchi subsp. incaldanensis]